MLKQVLWISEDGSHRAVQQALEASGVKVIHRQSGLGVARRPERVPADVIVLSLPGAGWSAPEMLRKTESIYPNVPILIALGRISVENASRLVRLGFWFAFGPESDAAQVVAEIEAAARNSAGSRPQTGRSLNPGFVWAARRMGEVAEAIELLGPRRCTVLITGETGTGKEVVAKALHSASARANRPLVAVCCSAIPDQLLESELFGHVKGAFTGASNNRIGRFEEAQGGTIFLDEIGDMPPVLQSKLLRVLQEREFQKLGSSETVRVDVRILAATNAKLLEKIRRGEFREDLYYRLKVGVIEVPPLRDRIDDIPALATYFLARTCQLEGLPEKRLAPEMMEALLRYRWPGNVRELENAIEAAVAMSGARSIVEPGDFRLEFVSPPAICAGQNPLPLPDSGLDFEETVGRFQLSLLQQALARSSGNKSAAADLLRLKRTTLSAKLRALSPEAVDLRTETIN